MTPYVISAILVIVAAVFGHIFYPENPIEGSTYLLAIFILTHIIFMRYENEVK